MEGWRPNLTWVAADLAIGGSFPPGAAERLACDHAVGAVIDLRAEACDDRDELAGCGISFLHLPTDDMLGVSQPMLEAGVRFAAAVRAAGRRLLIHCEHGIGRSATLALCVLVDRGLEPLDALRTTKDARAVVSPSEAQYRAWIEWTQCRFPGTSAPSFHEFGMVAYRHLAAAG